jgi:NADH/NAD ratio-sensing transcriptional regulator Rex
VLEKVEKAGIRAVLNFAPAPLKASDEIRLKSVDLTSSLESLSFFLAGNTEPAGDLKPKAKSRRI